MSSMPKAPEDTKMKIIATTAKWRRMLIDGSFFKRSLIADLPQ